MPAALTITGNTNDALAAIARLERQYDSLENKLKQVGKKSKESTDGFDSMTRGAMGFATSLTGIGSGLDLVNKGIALAKLEWEDLLTRQGKALTANQTYAKTLETLAFNTAGDAKYDTLSKVEKLVGQISKESGVGVNEVARALSTAASAKGHLSLEDAAESVRATMKFSKFDAALQDVMAGAVLDIRKSHPAATAEGAIGFTAMLGQQARITEPELVAKSAVPAVLLMGKSGGGTPEENAGIYAAITQAAVDTTGKRSLTGGIALTEQLKAALPELGSTLERIDFMQSHPELRQQFIHGGGKFKGLQLDMQGPGGETMSFGTDRASFEKRVKPAIEDLLTKGSSTDEGMRAAIKAMPSLAQGVAVFDKAVGALESSESTRVARTQQAFASETERSQIGDTGGATSAAFRGGLDEMSASKGIGWWQRQQMGYGRFAREMMGQSTPEASLNTVRAEIATIEREFTQRPWSKDLPANLKALKEVESAMAPAAIEDRITVMTGEARDRQGRINDATAAGDSDLAGSLRAMQEASEQQVRLLERQLAEKKARPINLNPGE